MFLLDTENVVDTKTKQSVHGDKQNYISIESYFSRNKVFNRDLGLKKKNYINTVMNIKYELCTIVFLTLL